MALRSSLIASALVAFFCFPPLTVRVRAQDGLQLFHKMQTALGGEEKMASIRDFEECVRAETWDNEGKAHGIVRKRVRLIRPNYLRLDQVGPGDTYVLFFDGTSGWEILPDKTVADLTGGELQFAQDYLRGLNSEWLADRDAQNVFASPAPNVITITTKNDTSHKTEITFDPTTFLPVKRTLLSLADPNHPVSSQMMVFEQWESVHGLQFPHRRSNFHFGKKLAEITTEQIRLDTGIKLKDLAIKPTDLNPVMCSL
ncbi:MAG: hypothetical protein DMG41_10170 [Acidobacteria bacterium]|nr:MAG: hypothetical protein AUH13_31635 [Acidobacteria bacterium 13_2_20CM_58_27]PYT67111.1 MAG: hypothetical protein DMG42_27755 [Acidobacteriota bacterium]PYT88946.1 MAG: hypothetical protein DMG41_10170 [Acidobacteriota bacterium]